MSEFMTMFVIMSFALIALVVVTGATIIAVMHSRKVDKTIAEKEEVKA